MGPLIADKNLLISSGMDFRLGGDIDLYPDGIIIPIDKPYRWTSADVIRKIKFTAVRHFGKKNLKVGHAGTLDPLATGVLLVCIGKATKLAEELQKHDKEYLAGISFGATTPSYDLEKPVDRTYPHEMVTKEAIEKVLPSFLGEQEQIAPLFSAKSVDGVRAYEIARKMYKAAQRGECTLQQSKESLDSGAEDILSKQVIRITAIRLEGFAPEGIPPRELTETEKRNLRINVTDNSALHLPHADIRVACSKGTYIRALARDLGEALGTGAHLDSLERTVSGDFRVENALSIEEALSILRTEA